MIQTTRSRSRTIRCKRPSTLSPSNAPAGESCADHGAKDDDQRRRCLAHELQQKHRANEIDVIGVIYSRCPQRNDRGATYCNATATARMPRHRVRHQLACAAEHIIILWWQTYASMWPDRSSSSQLQTPSSPLTYASFQRRLRCQAFGFSTSIGLGKIGSAC